MDSNSINQGIQNEMVKILSQKKHNQGGTINMLDVIEEATYNIAMNVILAQKRIKKESGGKLLFVHPESVDSTFEGMKIAIMNIFPGSFKEEYLMKIKENYLDLMSQNDLENKINNHYRTIFNDNSIKLL